MKRGAFVKPHGYLTIVLHICAKNAAPAYLSLGWKCGFTQVKPHPELSCCTPGRDGKIGKLFPPIPYNLNENKGCVLDLFVLLEYCTAPTLHWDERTPSCGFGGASYPSSCTST